MRYMERARAKIFTDEFFLKSGSRNRCKAGRKDNDVKAPGGRAKSYLCYYG